MERNAWRGRLWGFLGNRRRGSDMTCWGRLFQVRAAATGKTWSLTVDSRVRWNLMKMLDISFIKTELNLTDLKIQKLKTHFPQFCFSKTTLAVLGQFFMLSHSQFIFQPDRIISQRLKVFSFMPHICISSSESLQYCWLLVGPVLHGSTLFLVSCRRGTSERGVRRSQTNGKKQTGKKRNRS